MKSKRSKQVREQLQIYLDAPDHALLESMVKVTGLPRTELFRRGLRKLANDTLGEKKPGWSFEALIGIMGDQPDLPRDFSVRHDEYLYPVPKPRRRARPG